ncbi:MAG: hypothetical protein LUE17_11050, partial [Planctomycetaceae bacterium]|nr:hypothetical protein [Planctomycetaceae bacterium]
MSTDRIENVDLRKRAASPEEAAALVQDGMTVAFGGYTSCGYPKLTAGALAERKKKSEAFRINLLGGAQVGAEVFETLAGANLLDRCAPLIDSKTLAKQINAGHVHYLEQQMCKIPRLLASGGFGHIDVAVVEALAITREGYLVPNNALGMVPAFLDAAERIVVEVNSAQPEQLGGLADVYLPSPPPNTEPIPLTGVLQRIGQPFIQVDPGKIACVVESDVPELQTVTQPADALKPITENLLNFLEAEANRHWNGSLLPIQTGFGNLTNAILMALGESHFTDLQFFCGGVSENHVRLMAGGGGCRQHPPGPLAKHKT